MAKKILIVDDEPNIVISLEFLMKKEGFEVAVANDGDEALAMVASFNPDMLLLDVMMPKKSGFEVCEALRADTHHSIKAVLTTHVDTASSVRNDVAALRRVMDAVGHPALLAIDWNSNESRGLMASIHPAP